MSTTDSTFFPISIPEPNAELEEILAFAVTYNGYQAHGSFEACAAIANSALADFEEKRTTPSSLVHLRTCLFFETRR